MSCDDGKARHADVAPRRRTRPWSLAARLTAWYFASSFSLVLLATGVLYWTFSNGLIYQDDQLLLNKLHALRALLRADPQDSEKIAQEVGEDTDAPRQTYVRVLTGAGDILHESRGMASELSALVFPKPDASGGDRGVTVRAAASGKPFRLLSGHATAAGSRPAGIVVQVAADISDDEDLLAEYREVLGAVLAAALLLCGFVGYQIARAGLGPLRRIARATSEIGTSTLDHRVETRGLPAELRELATTFNAMLDRLEASFNQLRRFSDDIAHELRTPINRMLVGAEVALGKARTADEYRDILEAQLEDCTRLSRMVQGLLFLARSEHPQARIEREAISVARELTLIRDFYEATASEAGIGIAVDVDPEGLTAMVDRTLFQRAVSNLVANAVANTRCGDTVRLRARDKGNAILVEVADAGIGIAAEHLPHVFDRFYRADPMRSTGSENLGLGLSIVRSIAALHGGRVRIESTPNEGTRVALELPKS